MNRLWGSNVGMPSLLLAEIIAYQEAYPTWVESTMECFNRQFNKKKRDSHSQHSSFSVSLVSPHRQGS